MWTFIADGPSTVGTAGESGERLQARTRRVAGSCRLPTDREVGRA